MKGITWNRQTQKWRVRYTTPDGWSKVFGEYADLELAEWVHMWAKATYGGDDSDLKIYEESRK